MSSAAVVIGPLRVNILIVKFDDDHLLLHYVYLCMYYSDTSTPYHKCSKILISTIYYPLLCLKVVGCGANSVDPDELLHFAASHLGLHCLLRPVCPNTYGKYSMSLSKLFKSYWDNVWVILKGSVHWSAIVMSWILPPVGFEPRTLWSQVRNANHSATLTLLLVLKILTKVILLLLCV